MGFHSTEMPIKACADKLINEFKLFGQNFERDMDEDAKEDKTNPTSAPTSHHEHVTKFTARVCSTGSTSGLALEHTASVQNFTGTPNS